MCAVHGTHPPGKLRLSRFDPVKTVILAIPGTHPAGFISIGHPANRATFFD